MKAYRINLNELARVVTLIEGGAQSLSIAQVKEVQRLTLDALWCAVKVRGVNGIVAVLDACERSSESLAKSAKKARR